MAIKNLGRVVGADGKSAYQIWLDAGNTGTEQVFLDSLKGQNGKDGKGIVSIEKTNTEGLVDTYTINYTDETTSTFDVTNGKDGATEEGGTSGNVPTKLSEFENDTGFITVDDLLHQSKLRSLNTSHLLIYWMYQQFKPDYLILVTKFTLRI